MKQSYQQEYICVQSPMEQLQENIHSAKQILWFIGMLAATFLVNDAAQAGFTLGESGDCTVGSTGTIIFNALTGGKGTGVNPACQLFEAVDTIMRGVTGKVICTIAIIAMGFAALFGKVSYPTALITALGVGLIFGAGELVRPQQAQDISLWGVGETATSLFGMTLPGDPDPIGATLMTLAGAMTGPTGRAVAMAGLIIIGIGALFGKVTYLQGLMWGAGIGLVFGAGQIMSGTLASSFDILDGTLMAAGTLDDPIGEPFMVIITMFLSSTGIAIGTLGIMACGFAALIGKLSWPRAMMLGAGIALLYGAIDVLYILMGPLNPCVAGNNTSDDAFQTVICGFMDELQGPAGQTIGTLAIMILGILAVMGKISWEMGFVVTAGVALIFGANAIVQAFETSLGGITCASDAPTVPDTGNAIADVLCYIILVLYGPAGKALATIAVTMMGFGALMGKVTFSQAFVVAVGIAVTFGAPTIVKNLLPDADIGGCTLTNTGAWNGAGVPGLGNSDC